MTERENMLRLHRHEIPEWIPQNFAAIQLFSPSCYLSEGEPGKGGTDLFGVRWIVEDNAPTGAIADPKFHIVPDVEDLPNWRDYLTLPDIEAWDWAGAAAHDLPQFDRENRLICTNILDGNFNRLQAVMGTCEALIAMMEEPEAVHDFFDYHTDLKIRMLQKIVDYYHPDIVICGDDVCSSTGLFFSKAMYDEFIKPYEKRLTQAIKSYGLICQHHVCGKCEAIIPDIIDNGADVIETMQPYMNDIVKMKDLYGDKVIFDGGWDSYGPHNRADATEDQIRAEVHRVIDTYCQDGLFIVYGGAILPGSTPAEVQARVNGFAFAETQNYSREFLKKRFG